MRNFFRFSLTAIVFLFLSGAFAVTETKAQNVIGDVLKRMDTHNKSLQTLQANVAMDKYNSQLDEHDIYEGKTIYYPQRNSKPYIRIDWSKPVEESLAVVKGQYTLYRPRIPQVIIGSVGKAQNSGKSGGALEFINMSKAELKANYTIRYVGREGIIGGVQTSHLELIPKKASNYKVADIWVDDDGMPRQMKVTEKNNDTTNVLLTAIEKNKTIDLSVFEINYPKNTKVVKG